MRTGKLSSLVVESSINYKWATLQIVLLVYSRVYPFPMGAWAGLW
jgi:hypothetical protein